MYDCLVTTDGRVVGVLAYPSIDLIDINSAFVIGKSSSPALHRSDSSILCY